MKTYISLLSAARSALSRLWALLFLFTLAGGLPAAHAQSVPVTMNMPVTVTGNILPGATALDIPFNISAADGLRFDLIVPVNGATLSLIDPSGNVAIGPQDPHLSFESGSGRTPPLPGGVFTATELATPADGVWILRVSFPAAPTKTAAIGTVFARSRYQVGIAIERTTLLVGEDVGVGLLVLDNGQPIKSLTPTIAIGFGAPGAPQSALDNGQGADGLANDGVYSVDHTFAAAGTYDIIGNVSIPTPKGLIQRSANAQVRVVPAQLEGRSIDLLTQRGANNCVSGLQVNVGFNVLKAARYSTLVRLAAPNGKYIDVRKAGSYQLGPVTVSANYSAADLKAKLGSDGPFRVSQIDTLELGADEFTLAFRKRDAGVFNVNLADLCAGAIELQKQLSVTPVLQDGYIASFKLAFPVKVRSAGFYQISFKVVGPNGEDIALLNASRSLQAGDNLVEANLASDKFQTVDGPYQAISLVVVQGANSARLTNMGSTDSYSRWQFYPKKAGDLDGDGVVGPADVSLITQQRGAAALKPGDRRDINRDGVIDLRDARALQQLR
ncbi:choice-of-anchor X domain-containing protein [Massilia sp. BJB1822]|uniref:choice-of-anchor X domain-containing protein n=1 Tax=Massilia sp. BJB1822 TaxID=2744470 RepID=UPI0015938D12|nr:choice-of-anchor X domain-containing protein [Massilia sp. BJB1822]NVD97575.1 hypothetical protein [Massilia sp. BJB1822]